MTQVIDVVIYDEHGEPMSSPETREGGADEPPA
jgi:hypothetical protein